MMRFRHDILRTVLNLFMGLVCTSGLMANEREVALKAELLVSANDNYDLVAANQKHVNSTRGAFTASYRSQDERTASVASVSSGFTKYGVDDESISSRAFQRYAWQLDAGVSEKVSQQLSVSVTKDSTASDEYELLQSGFDLKARSQDKKRITRQGGMAVSIQHSESTSTAWNIGYSGVSYDDAYDTQLVNYDYYSGSFQLNKSLSERVSVYSVAAMLRYSPEPKQSVIQNLNATDTSSRSLSLGGNFDLSERQVLRASAGLRKSHYKPVFESANNETARLFDVSYEYAFDSAKLKSSYVRALTPSSNGQLSDNSELRITFLKQASARTDYSLEAVGERQLETGTESQVKDEFFLFKASLRRRVLPDLIMNLGFKHRRAFDQDIAESNSAYLSFVWEPRGLVW